jgi:hypothetical protein
VKRTRSCTALSHALRAKYVAEEHVDAATIAAMILKCRSKAARSRAELDYVLRGLDSFRTLPDTAKDFGPSRVAAFTAARLVAASDRKGTPPNAAPRHAFVSCLSAGACLVRTCEKPAPRMPRKCA